MCLLNTCTDSLLWKSTWAIPAIWLLLYSWGKANMDLSSAFHPSIACLYHTSIVLAFQKVRKNFKLPLVLNKNYNNFCLKILHSCRARLKVWNGVWALVLLTYAPLCYTCVMILNCPKIADATSGIDEVPVSIVH